MIRFLWALPLTLVGLIVGMIDGGGLHGGAGPILHVIIRPGWILDRLLPKPFAAITLGYVVFFRDLHVYANPALIVHEHEHVRQAGTWGPLFPLLYAGASLHAWVTGRRAYEDNYFERRARSVARDFTEELLTGKR